MIDKYILNGTEIVQIDDVIEWEQWFEEADRHVAYKDIAEGIYVSTIFLGLDHQCGNGPPLLFETMVFWDANKENNNYMERYSTWHEAEQGHERVCALVRAWIEDLEGRVTNYEK